MQIKLMLAVALTVGVLLGTTLVGRAEDAKDKSLKVIQDEISAIEKELEPIGTWASKLWAVDGYKADRAALDEAQTRHDQAWEAIMIKVDPEAKDLLEKRAKLRQELAAAKGAGIETKELQDKLAAIEKDLAPIGSRAWIDDEYKVARAAYLEASAKYRQAWEAAMIKEDPKAKELLEKLTKLREEAGALKKAAAEKKDN
jgi:hypothetical protein